MRDYRLRTDLQRAVIDGFALPLGLEAADASFQAPVQGYTLSYTPGEDDGPDTYAFHVVVSHERLSGLLAKAFTLLPREVSAIVEIASRDAYRTTDVYISGTPIPLSGFLKVWKHYEPFLLEETAIAAGANSEDPFLEVFMDQWKGVSIHVPPERREQVESMLHEFDLEEVQQTWAPPADTEEEDEVAALMNDASPTRQVLDLSDDYAPDIDEVLMELRHDWQLELNLDLETNVDESGRELGQTLWHVVIIVQSTTGETDAAGMPLCGYASIWATAGSMAEIERLYQSALAEQERWQMVEVYIIDRVAFDERPDTLAHLKPGQRSPMVHEMMIEPWDIASTEKTASNPPASDEPRGRGDQGRTGRRE